jgi:hypothetical protein
MRKYPSAAVLALFISFGLPTLAQTQTLEITVIDVHQGDSILMSSHLVQPAIGRRC